MKCTNGLHISPTDRLTQLSSCSFGASVTDIFGALLNGACLYPFMLKEEGFDRLSHLMQKGEITVYHSVPSVYRYFVRTLSDDAQFPKLRLIKLGGEAVTKRDFELYKKHFSKDCLFHVGYGATEMNIIRQFFCDHSHVINAPILPVGYAVDDTDLSIEKLYSKAITCLCMLRKGFIIPAISG
jgi:non-ribosomal peptide synthetase component F